MESSSGNLAPTRSGTETRAPLDTVVTSTSGIGEQTERNAPGVPAGRGAPLLEAPPTTPAR